MQVGLKILHCAQCLIYLIILNVIHVNWHTGFFKKNSHPVKLIAKKLACPLSPNSMLLHRFASKGLQKKQPFRFGCRHALGNNIDQGGAGGSGVMWQHVGGWLFFWRTRGRFFGLRMCKYKLEPIPFCMCQNLNPSTLAASKLLPTNKDATDSFFSFMDVQTQAWTNSLLHVPKPQPKHTFIFRAATHKQRSNIAAFAPHVGKNWRSELCVLHGALM